MNPTEVAVTELFRLRHPSGNPMSAFKKGTKEWGNIQTPRPAKKPKRK